MFDYMNINQIFLKIFEISLTNLIYHVERLLKTTLIVKYLEESKKLLSLALIIHIIYSCDNKMSIVFIHIDIDVLH